MKESIFKKPGVQTLLSSLICIAAGLLVGFIILAIINPSGAGKAIMTIILNFMTRATPAARMKVLGNMLTKTAPLLMCALSVCFCYKVGLFNIGAAGQYEAGACAALYCAIGLKLPWFVCLIAAGLAGAFFGAIVGFLKAYRNVNEVISGIMLNWILLYLTNMILGVPSIKEATSPYTIVISSVSRGSLLPTMGLGALFADNKYVTIAVPLSIIIAVIIWVVLEKTKFGYELRATGFNKDASRYAGMKEKKNIIITLAIGGALASLGAAFLFLSGYQQWQTTITSVPGMGFNGIAATFLGGLNPIGTIFSSYFIQSITEGGAMINRSLYPSEISNLISAVIIYLCGFVLFFKTVMNARIRKNEEKLAKKAEGGNK
ncbi:MAG: ABC transporter permease [Solobacterium sp.]|nr:ABC transporter permease [Solobacterium sp.]